MRDRVLIDTSVWIDYFQNAPSSLSEKIDEFLSHKEIFVPKVVVAELIQGAKSEKEIGVIKQFLEAFNVIGEGGETWIKAGRLSYDLKKKGTTINLTDCYIAVMAQENKCAIMTLDKHFKEVWKHDDGLRLIEI